MFNVQSTTTQVQLEVDSIVHFQLTWYLSTTFRRHLNLFLKVRLQILRRRVPASSRCLYNARWYADRLIRRCIINLHRNSWAYNPIQSTSGIWYRAFSLPGPFAPCSESANRTLADSLPGQLAPCCFRFLTLSFPGPFIPWNFRSVALSLQT